MLSISRQGSMEWCNERDWMTKTCLLFQWGLRCGPRTNGSSERYSASSKFNQEFLKNNGAACAKRPPVCWLPHCPHPFWPLTLSRFHSSLFFMGVIQGPSMKPCWNWRNYLSLVKTKIWGVLSSSQKVMKLCTYVRHDGNVRLSLVLTMDGTKWLYHKNPL